MKKVFLTVALASFVGAASISAATFKGDDKDKKNCKKECKKGDKSCCKKGDKAGETKTEDKK